MPYGNKKRNSYQKIVTNLSTQGLEPVDGPEGTVPNIK
jgi:hypothetical protein